MDETRELPVGAAAEPAGPKHQGGLRRFLPLALLLLAIGAGAIVLWVLIR